MSQRSSSARYGRATTASGRRRRSSLQSRGGGWLRRHRGVRILLLVLAALSGLGAAAVGVVYAEYQNLKSQLPDAATLAAMEPPLDTNVYARDGTLIAVLHNSDFRHEHIALKDVSHWAKVATVDVEDKHFYEHASWDLPRIVKAAYDNLRHEANAGGASTITEQLAKVSFLSPERSLDRKVKQVILGAEIEGEFSKDQILEMYLNRIPYGNHAIGIQTAAEVYFHKSAHDLDLAEASMLAGLPNSPTTFNPLNNTGPGVPVNPLAKDRQRVVLQAMVNSGDITQKQADDAYDEKLAFHQWYEAEKNDYPAFMDFLRKWLDEKYGDEYIKPGGWDIHTTLDIPKQNLAQSVVKKGVAAITDKNAHDGTLVSMDPKTGEVLALVGASDPNDKTINTQNLALNQYQPGSTIKLFTYTAAIASRQFTMSTPIADTPITLYRDGKPYTPHNYDHSYHGTCSLAVCLGNSFNIPAVKVEAKVGIPFITDLEIASGLTSLKEAGNRPDPDQWPATLGGLTYGVTPLEMADGVSTIANLGVQHDPMPVTGIVDRSTGKVVYAYDAKAVGRRVVPQGVAFIMSEITSNDNNRVREFGYHSDLTLPDRRVSAKTGTTEDFASNWTVGWTPNLVTVVAVLNPTPNCLGDAPKGSIAKLQARGVSKDDINSPWTPQALAAYGITVPKDARCGPLIGSTGITGAAPIWHDYMKAATSGMSKAWYTKPADVVGSSHNDDGAFYLPGTQTQCYYYAPKPDPDNICQYSGVAPPAPSPTPTPSPAPAPGPGGAPPPSQTPAPTSPTPGPTHKPRP